MMYARAGVLAACMSLGMCYRAVRSYTGSVVVANFSSKCATNDNSSEQKNLPVNVWLTFTKKKRLYCVWEHN